MEKKYYTILDKNNGQELRGQFDGDELGDNEIEIEDKRTEYMENPYFDFVTKQFYDKV